MRTARTAASPTRASPQAAPRPRCVRRNVGWRHRPSHQSRCTFEPSVANRFDAPFNDLARRAARDQRRRELFAVTATVFGFDPLSKTYDNGTIAGVLLAGLGGGGGVQLARRWRKSRNKQP